ncbi:unnamed protein product [Dovyalis caffra]|uniref:Uncharacterized protein n=1 Tax=Dovyalis caffra TaxID=77055 RepID=A0AAV1RCI1_9ROSI|nr:unnamed protein product [Dovyalis caffra]
MKGLKKSLQIAKNELVSLLIRFEDRVSRGFNRELQDLVLKSNIFCLLEKIVWDPELLKKVLCSLIKSIKSPLVDEIESNGEIPKIISFLDYKDLHFRAVAMDCILEIGYFGQKEAIEAMLKEGLIKKLVELQRLELGGDLIDMGILDHERENGEGEKIVLESHPFADCVARFAVQLEVGEGLRQRERRAFKQEILNEGKFLLRCSRLLQL